MARAIAGVQREAVRERELRDAQFAVRMAELDARIASVAEAERRLSEKMATLRDGEPGRSVTVEEVTPLILAEVERRIAAIPAPKDGIDGEAGKDGENGRDGADGKDGASVTLDDLAPMVAEAVNRAVASLPAPENGKDGADGRDGVDGKNGTDGSSVTIADVEPIIRELVAAIPAPKDGADGKDGKDGERGPEGPIGKLPLVREWADGVHYEGAVVTREGGVYQAIRDTGKEPGHDDWLCIVTRGRDGEDGRSFTIRGTFASDQEYRALDVVALNGASFAARRDNPGECPGEGWQLIASQGRQGKPGERGASIKGDRGPPGPGLSELAVDGNGLLTARNGDGTEVECDLYPILSRLG